MIKSLTIKNFQSHLDTTLELSDGVNVIVGPTDSGKTSIIRTVRKIVWNRPSGDAFRSNWGGEVHIEIVTDTDIIEWFTSSNGQVYRLNKNTVFKAVGTNVPEEIQKALNINEINLQQQLDQPFLLTSTPGEVAQHFNRIAKLDQIDTALRNVNKWIRSITSEKEFNEQELENQKESLKEFDHLDKFEAEVEVLEEMAKQRDRALNSYHTIKRMLDQIKNIDSDIALEQEMLADENLIDETLDMIYKRDGLEDGPIATINELIETAESVEDDIISMQDKLIELEQEFEETFPQICPLCGKPKNMK